MTRALLLLLLPVLAGCAASASTPTTEAPRPQIATPPTVAPVMQVQGLEGVIGADAAALIDRFGQPRLDLSEGDARKLQFASNACVIDIYLYTLQAGGERRASHVDARLRDGQAADPASCIAALGS